MNTLENYQFFLFGKLDEGINGDFNKMYERQFEILCQKFQDWKQHDANDPQSIDKSIYNSMFEYLHMKRIEAEQTKYIILDEAGHNFTGEAHDIEHAAKIVKEAKKENPLSSYTIQEARD
jgi:hypothetical protein